MANTKGIFKLFRPSLYILHLTSGLPLDRFFAVNLGNNERNKRNKRGTSGTEKASRHLLYTKEVF